MNQIVQFLKECGTFYLATLEGNQPRVRPFGAVLEWDGKIYLCTGNKKDVFAQILKNPKVEISGQNSSGSWIRIAAELIPDARKEAKIAMLEEYPSLTRMYDPADDVFEVMYLQNGTATINTFGEEPEVHTL